VLEVRRSAFCHEVLFYDCADEFLAGTVPFVRAALDAEEPALVAATQERIELLEGELGGDAALVGFADMEELGRNPARIIPAWREFVDRHGGLDRPVRGIGEPIWPQRSAAEVDECQRHESLLNLAFGGLPAWSLLCPYDSSRLEDGILEAARASHPFFACNGESLENSAADLEAWSPFAGELSPRPDGAEALRFDRDTLHWVRKLVSREAEGSGLSQARGDDLVTAVSELAANSVLHGGGGGTLSLWQEPDALVVEAVDLGYIEEPLVGRRRPTPTQEGGRGLWLVNQLCDLVQIRSSPAGSAIRLRMSLSL
jgi:anti-sigma regulatory factor (Ser/Thr protein kinase)